MKKRMIALMMLAVLLLSMAACAKEETEDTSGITEQKACQIAVSDAGHSVTEVTGLHTHEGEQNGALVYEIHFSCGEVSYTYLIHGETGEILSKG